MILNKIMTHKRREIELRQRVEPLSELKVRGHNRTPPVDFARALLNGRVCLIAEIKRASPSKGVLCADWNPERLARTYTINGAAAISVLTDEKFFQGRLEYLAGVRSATRDCVPIGEAQRDQPSLIPLLRKDFIFDAYQVYESYAYGADALLLIAAVLPDALLASLLALSQDLGMMAVVEVHDEEELQRVLRLHPRIVGINNRNLRSFNVNLDTFGRLRSLIPDDIITVAESGVHSAADVRRLARMGADAVLVGEALVTASDVAAKVRELTGFKRIKPRIHGTKRGEP